MPKNTNGNWKVPPEIRALKPKGTLVKKGHDDEHYYVYEHSNVKGEDGKWHTKNGKLIGYIQPGLGFIRNDQLLRKQAYTILEYGQYALAFYNAGVVRNELNLFFEPSDASRIFVIGLLFAVNGKQALYNIQGLFEQSWLSIYYPTLKMGEDTIRQLLDDLGRRTEKPDEFGDYQISESSSQLIIDGHGIRNCSRENDLAGCDDGYLSCKDTQINILTIFDGITHKPLCNRICAGNEPDQNSVKELIDRRNIRNKLFTVDEELYSLVNLNVFSKNGNHYIIPLKQNTADYSIVTSEMNFTNRFVYRNGEKKSGIESVIEYKEYALNDGVTRIFVYRDINRNVTECESYEKHLLDGTKGYTREQYNILKEFFGTLVLQTDCTDLTAETSYCTFKGKWHTEMPYDFLRNEVDFNSLGIQSHYELDGYSFILLISRQISYCIDDICSKVNLSDVPGKVLLDARGIKIHLQGNTWKVDEGLVKGVLNFMTSYNIPYQAIESNYVL